MSDVTLVKPTAAGTPKIARREHIPGEAGLWVFILGDATMFAFFFGQFVYARGSQPGLFNTSRSELSIFFGAFNTCLLLTGSLFVVWGMAAIRRADAELARRFFILAFATGAWFLVDKVLEWGSDISRGFNPITNDFFTYFFVFTGIHAVHVTIGLCVLTYLIRLCRRTDLGERDRHTFESGSVYWHLVDLLWIILFALLYLMA